MDIRTRTYNIYNRSLDFPAGMADNSPMSKTDEILHADDLTDAQRRTISTWRAGIVNARILSGKLVIRYKNDKLYRIDPDGSAWEVNK